MSRVSFLLVSILALCGAVPLVPFDNSHYVEGESRYVWMPNGEGVPVLVDLQAPLDEEVLRQTRNGANNQYWLYTRSNPTEYQLLVHGDADSVWSSNYNSNLPTTVIVHGWNNNGNSDMNPLITSALLEVADVNVIILDWSSLASSLYTTAVNGAPSVGNFLGSFIQWLFTNAGGNVGQLHLVGFSLGAHIVGNAGRALGGEVVRVTGLDPAGPQWGDNSLALATDCGIYVESIHTNGGIFGIMDPISHADFYPNGGRSQPGCGVLLPVCSHGRSPELFAASVSYNSFIATSCDSLEDAEDMTCSGDQVYMGNSDLTKTASGLFSLTTGSTWPF